MADAGHVFVVRGDLNAIACDWQVVSSGTDWDGRFGHIRPIWLENASFRRLWEASGLAGVEPSDAKPAVLLRGDPHERGYIVVLAGDRGDEPAEWFTKPITAIGTLLARSSDAPLNDRERTLVALPALGTGHGGAADRKSGVMEVLLGTAEQVASEVGIDFVFVLRDPQAYSAVQRLRSSPNLSIWRPHLSDPSLEAAGRVAQSARSGKLVPFIGAGLSASAGLPTWRKLLETLGREANLDQKERDDLLSMDARDAGAVLEHCIGGGRGLDRALRKLFAEEAPPSLGHCLLASLPINEAATTNYDSMFEKAWEAATGQLPAVIPRDPATSSPRWLLKLHGDVADPTRPLVLSRDQYFELERTSGAIAAVVQAMLLTRHLLLVGYGLQDETFHRIAYEVRLIQSTPSTRIVASASQGARESGDDDPPSSTRLGTALVIGPIGLFHEVWKPSLELVPLASDAPYHATGSRRVEIFLDLVGHLAAPAGSYLLGDGWHELSDPSPDHELRQALLGVADVVSTSNLPPQLNDVARSALRQFGWAR